MARAKIDWEAVEIDFRAGVKTLRVMASEHGCAESAIRKKAKQEGWERDLAEKVRQKADELVRKEVVRTKVRTETPSEKLQIEVLAQTTADIVLGHRKDIGRSRGLVMSLLTELEQQCANPEALEAIARMVIGGMDGDGSKSDKDVAKLWDAFNRAVSLGGRTDTMKKLSDSLKTLVALEREAFNIDGEKEKGGRIEDWLDNLT